MGFLAFLKSMLLLIIARGIGASVYSCEEVRYRLINSTFTQSTRYACVVTQEGFSNWNQLEKVYAQLGIYYTSLHDIATSSGGCIENTKTTSPWNVIADDGLSLKCDQEFSLVLTSDLPKFIAPHREEERYRLDSRRVIAVPQTGMWIHKRKCVGNGNLTVYTGAGRGRGPVQDEIMDIFNGTSCHSESVVFCSIILMSCSSLPDWLFSFDTIITIDVDPTVEYTMECSTMLELDAMVMASPGDRIAVLTSGRSDDRQNMEGNDRTTAFVLIGEWETHEVTVDMQLTFDPSNTGSIVLQKAWEGKEFNYYDGTYSEKFTTNFFEVRYVPKSKQPSEIWNSQDNIIIELSIDSKAPSTAPTTAPAVHSTYCDCSVDSSGAPVGWKYDGIWLDVVVILDTSEAMGQKALDEASALIESLLSNGGKDLLITDAKAQFYTRVGVIAMADSATSNVLQFQLSTMNSNMFNHGGNRDSTRRVIYYMTDSDTTDSLNSLSAFKSSDVIIVNNFLQPGELERPGLKRLASDGYFYSNNNDYTASLHAFCKSNCHCKSFRTIVAYGGSDPAVIASGGCYDSAQFARVSFSYAQGGCADDGGILASIHDDDKGRFLEQMMPNAKSDYFWFGYSKSDDGVWRWEDKSTDPYTNWGVEEPSSAPVAKCAYVDKSNHQLTWGAGNCQVGFPYVCEYPPCSVGHKDCML